MPFKISDDDLLDLMDQYPGASDEELARLAKRNYIQRAWDWANTPLLPEFAQPTSTAGKLGHEFARGLTSPLSIGLALLSGGATTAARAGMFGLAKNAKRIEQGINAAFAGEGAYRLARGKTPGEKLAGGAQAGLGALGAAVTRRPLPVDTILKARATPTNKYAALMDEAFKLTKQTGGATLNAKQGNMVGRDLYAVGGVVPGVSLPTTASKRQQRKTLEKFIRDNEKVWENPDNSLGLWVDKDSGKIVFDASETVPRSKAIESGVARKEDAIFGLKDFDTLKLDPYRSQRQLDLFEDLAPTSQGARGGLVDAILGTEEPSLAELWGTPPGKRLVSGTKAGERGARRITEDFMRASTGALRHIPKEQHADYLKNVERQLNQLLFRRRTLGGLGDVLFFGPQAGVRQAHHRATGMPHSMARVTLEAGDPRSSIHELTHFAEDVKGKSNINAAYPAVKDQYTRGYLPQLVGEDLVAAARRKNDPLHTAAIAQAMYELNPYELRANASQLRTDMLADAFAKGQRWLPGIAAQSRDIIRKNLELGLKRGKWPMQLSEETEKLLGPTSAWESGSAPALFGHGIHALPSGTFAARRGAQRIQQFEKEGMKRAADFNPSIRGITPEMQREFIDGLAEQLEELNFRKRAFGAVDKFTMDTGGSRYDRLRTSPWDRNFDDSMVNLTPGQKTSTLHELQHFAEDFKRPGFDRDYAKNYQKMEFGQLPELGGAMQSYIQRHGPTIYDAKNTALMQTAYELMPAETKATVSAVKARNILDARKNKQPFLPGMVSQLRDIITNTFRREHQDFGWPSALPYSPEFRKTLSPLMANALQAGMPRSFIKQLIENSGLARLRGKQPKLPFPGEQGVVAPEVREILLKKFMAEKAAEEAAGRSFPVEGTMRRLLEQETFPDIPGKTVGKIPSIILRGQDISVRKPTSQILEMAEGGPRFTDEVRDRVLGLSEWAQRNVPPQERDWTSQGWRYLFETPQESEQFAGLLAALSPQVNITPNTRDALRTFSLLKGGMAPEETLQPWNKMFPGVNTGLPQTKVPNVGKAWNLQPLSTKHPAKTDELAEALKGDPSRVPFDLWFNRALGHNIDEPPNPAEYWVMKQAWNDLTKQLSGNPFELMADTWTGIKTLSGDREPSYFALMKALGQLDPQAFKRPVTTPFELQQLMSKFNQIAGYKPLGRKFLPVL